jgi:transcriptional regulator with XRE-family HTH domain
MKHIAPIHISVQKAQGFHWLLRYMNGESLRGIARATNRSTATISKYMRKAAALMVDAAQEKILAEVFPLVVEVYKAHLNQQLDKAGRGEPIDMGEVNRLLKSMYVFDSPQIKDTIQAPPAEGEETLAGFLVRRTNVQLRAGAQKTIGETAAETQPMDAEVLDGH